MDHYEEESAIGRMAAVLAVACTAALSVTPWGCGSDNSPTGPSADTAGKPAPTHVRYSLTDLGAGAWNRRADDRLQMAGKAEATPWQETLYDCTTRTQAILDPNGGTDSRAINSASNVVGIGRSDPNATLRGVLGADVRRLDRGASRRADARRHEHCPVDQ